MQKCPRLADGSWGPHRCQGNWEYVVELGRDGKDRRRQVTRGGYPTRRAAVTALEATLDQARGGVDVGSDTTVAEYLDRWLASKRKIRASTTTSYRSHVDLYLSPLLGHLKLRELKASHVDVLLAALAKRHGKQPLSTATVRRIHSTLRVALNDAVRRRLLPFNPTQHVELPPDRHSPRSVWSPREVERFLHATSTDQFGAAYRVAIVTGMRRGEICGLRWRDVDLSNGLIRINQAAVQVGGAIHIEPPKTKTGIRTVPLDEETTAALERHFEQQTAMRKQWGEAYQAEQAYVFCREDGSLLSPERLSRRFKHASASAGLPIIRFHDLRHTSASVALAAGVALKVVSDRLGHSTTAITADLYTHVSPAVAREAAEAIARTINPTAGETRGERAVSAEPFSGADYHNQGGTK